MEKVIVLLAVIFFAASQALNEEQKNKLKAHYEKCVASTGVDKELILKGRKGEFTKDEKLAQYYFCMFNEIGIVNDNGELQIDVVKAKIPAEVKQEEAQKVIDACKDQKGENKYETSQKLYECYFKVSPIHITFA